MLFSRALIYIGWLSKHQGVPVRAFEGFIVQHGRGRGERSGGEWGLSGGGACGLIGLKNGHWH
jgi:hypothetical protein